MHSSNYHSITYCLCYPPALFKCCTNKTFTGLIIRHLRPVVHKWVLKKSIMDPTLVRIPQLTAARCKFDGLLQQVAERTEDESAREQTDPGDGKLFEKSGGAASHKGHGSQQHKSSVKPVKKKLEATANTVITKILDCSVDMANFSGRSPLYPMVRAWCRNDAHRDDVSSSGSGSDNEMLDDERVVTIMPPPTPRGPDVPRVPPPLPPHSGVHELQIKSEGEDLLDVETMLAEHRERWRLVRAQWADASALNEERYFESCEILSKCQSIEEPAEEVQEWEGIEPLP